jgi:UPF0755 protein
MRRALFGLALLIVGAGGFFLALLSPVQRSEPYTVAFTVLPGEGLRQIAGTLERVRIIRDAEAFMILARLRGEQSRLQAGPYEAASDEWAWTVLERLVEGQVEDTTVTVIEGLWMTEIADEVAPLVGGGADSFLVAARDSAWLAGFGVPAATAEGYLFPDTYRLIPKAPARALVAQMVRTFFLMWNDAMVARAESVGMTVHEVTTLASIVEAEAQVGEERPRIAAVYLNRLQRGLGLQADPTVSYAKGERLSRTLFADLETPSPYNTYRNDGLPPGPIGNPGLASLQAVLWPLEGCQDLFFVAAGDGTHLFAPDFEGHKRNRRIVSRSGGRPRPAGEDP